MKPCILNSILCDYFSEILREKVMMGCARFPDCGENILIHGSNQ
jgi:hypothetical protein